MPCLGISRSGFYRWLAAASARAARAAAEAELAERIRQIHLEWDGTYGSPRITASPPRLRRGPHALVV